MILIFFLFGFMYLNMEISVAFYFESSWMENKKYFPTFYWIFYPVFKLFFPLVYGTVVYKTLEFWKMRKQLIFQIILFQFVILQIIHFVGGFVCQLGYGLGLTGVFIGFYILKRPTIYPKLIRLKSKANYLFIANSVLNVLK